MPYLLFLVIVYTIWYITDLWIRIKKWCKNDKQKRNDARNS